MKTNPQTWPVNGQELQPEKANKLEMSRVILYLSPWRAQHNRRNSEPMMLSPDSS